MPTPRAAIGEWFDGSYSCRHPGERRYRIHTSLARHISAKHRPYTSRPRSGEREGPIAKQWEGEGRPCYLFFAAPRQTAGTFTRRLQVQLSAAPRDRVPLTLPTLTRWAPPSPRCRGARCIGDRRTRRQRYVHTIAKAGTYRYPRMGVSSVTRHAEEWVPAFAGMTGVVSRTQPLVRCSIPFSFAAKNNTDRNNALRQGLETHQPTEGE